MPSSYSAEFGSRDYKNFKKNQPREFEIDREWIPLDLSEMKLRFLVSGPVDLYEKYD